MLEGKDEDEVYDTAEKIDAISSENGAINCIIAESKKIRRPFWISARQCMKYLNRIS